MALPRTMSPATSPPRARAGRGRRHEDGFGAHVQGLDEGTGERPARGPRAPVRQGRPRAWPIVVSFVAGLWHRQRRARVNALAVYHVRCAQEGGKTPRADDPTSCHYKGTLIGGKEFDSSYKRGSPATFAPNQARACTAMLAPRRGWGGGAVCKQCRVTRSPRPPHSQGLCTARILLNATRAAAPGHVCI